MKGRPVASRLRFLRPVVTAPSEVDVQQMVYDLVLARATSMFGPGSSFAVTVRTDDDTDTLFGETVAETLAWDISLGLDTRQINTRDVNSQQVRRPLSA